MLKMIPETTYTAYTWVNTLYMNQKQWGIQTTHCVSNMSVDEFGQDIYQEWARNHQKVIMFDGKNSGQIRRIHEIIQFVTAQMASIGIEIPHTLYCEDIESLDGAATACGFIIPNVMREFTWDDSVGFSLPNSNRMDWSDAFLPSLQSGESLDTPYECTTEEYYKLITQRNVTIQELLSRGCSTLDGHKFFRLTEFSDWMRRQRTAN